MLSTKNDEKRQHLLDVALRLKKFRKENGYKNQESFALQLGITRAAYKNYEAGKSEPPPSILHALSTKFGADINYILTGRSEQDMPDVDAYLTRMGVDEMARTIIKSYMALPPDKRKIVKDYIDSLANEIVSNKNKRSTAPSETEPMPAAPDRPSTAQASIAENIAEDPAIEAEVSKIRARLYARDKTRRILTGSTDTAPSGTNKKTRR